MTTLTKDAISAELETNRSKQYAPEFLVNCIKDKLKAREYTVAAKRVWWLWETPVINMEITSSNCFWGIHKKSEKSTKELKLPDVLISRYLSRMDDLKNYSIKIISYTQTANVALISGGDKLTYAFKLKLQLQPLT